MKAAIIKEPGEVTIVNKEIPTPGEGQVLVKIHAAALNRRDQWIREGKYPGIKYGTTLGSDGAGVVEAVGSGVNPTWKGQEVLLCPNRNWGNNKSVQSKDYHILGTPMDGTFAEYITVPAHTLVKKPEHLSMEKAAAIPLGGLTAYRACFHHGRIKNESTVLISGFGGGVAQFAFQFALAAGSHVYVTSGNVGKREKALEMGAKGAFDYNDDDWTKDAKDQSGGFSVVIDSAGGDQINSFLKLMRPAGRIVFYGATNGLPAKVDLYRMFWNQITMQGSTMGSDEEFKEMVEFIHKKKITPIIDSVHRFLEIDVAFERIQANDSFGKIVLDLNH